MAFAVTVLAAQSGKPAPHSVIAVRHWSLGSVTRIAVEVSGEFQYRNDRLQSPDRIYYDILNARPNFENKRLYTENLDRRIVKRIRVAETLPGVTRVVLDLAPGVEAAASVLSSPDRLIIELRSGTSAHCSSAAAGNRSASTRDRHTRPGQARSLACGGSCARLCRLRPPSQSSLPPYLPWLSSQVPPIETARVVKPDPAPPVEVARAARHTAAGSTSLVRALGLKLQRVVIDPGHGGHDEGTQGPKGLLEKDLVLDVATRLGKLIEDRMGAEVIYTRSDDTFVPLEGRTALANDKKADLFLSSTPTLHPPCTLLAWRRII